MHESINSFEYLSLRVPGGYGNLHLTAVPAYFAQQMKRYHINRDNVMEIAWRRPEARGTDHHTHNNMTTTLLSIHTSQSQEHWHYVVLRI